MYVRNEKIKVNKFVVVAIPRNCDYMKRYGQTVAPSSSYTGDEIAPLPQNKVDMLAYADRYDAMMQQEEFRKAQEELRKSKENGEGV